MILKILCAAFIVLAFSACGDGSNTTSSGPTKLSNADMEVDSYSQLPSCAEKREGKTAYVADQEQGYICQGGEWVEDYNAVKVYSSSSEKSSSSGKNTNVTDDSVQTVDPSEVKKGTMTDSRDGQTYRTVKIGDQMWMAENLNYEMTDSYCYNDSVKYCKTYGRLYTWDAAMNACPSGWHLPSYAEFETLVYFVGGSAVAGMALRSTTGWISDGRDTDAFGFSALPAGYRLSNGGYLNGGYVAYFWSSTEYGSDYACFIRLDYYNDYAYLNDISKVLGLSVRCVKD